MSICRGTGQQDVIYFCQCARIGPGGYCPTHGVPSEEDRVNRRNTYEAFARVERLASVIGWTGVDKLVGDDARKTPIRHEGFHLRRLCPEAENSREVAFAEQWKEENETGLLLQLLLGPEENPLSPFGGKRERFAEVTQENASVAATVVQWLGSNIGMSFLELALKRCGYKIVKAGKEAGA